MFIGSPFGRSGMAPSEDWAAPVMDVIATTAGQGAR